jgi:hypothetical protein
LRKLRRLELWHSIYLRRQKIAEANAIFGELPSILRHRLRRDNDGPDRALF